MYLIITAYVNNMGGFILSVNQKFTHFFVTCVIIRYERFEFILFWESE